MSLRKADTFVNNLGIKEKQIHKPLLFFSLTVKKKNVLLLLLYLSILNTPFITYAINL